MFNIPASRFVGRSIATALLLGGWLSGCATLKNTPQQDYVWELGKVCELRVKPWIITRVEPDGQYHAHGMSATSGQDFLACMDEQIAQNPYRQWFEQHKAEYAPPAK